MEEALDAMDTGNASRPLPSSMDDSAFLQAPLKTPTKTRSLSDSAPALAPSPRFLEGSHTSQDDHAILSSLLRASTGSDPAARGLTLQLPPRDTNAFAPPPSSIRPTQSPRLEPADPYGSPGTVLPRHSRGMDFSRAATHLHHSTLAEHPSPESSPTITHRSLASRRTSSHSMALDSPRLNNGWSWNSGNNDKGFFPRSVGSTVALTSDTSGSDSGDEMEVTEQEEAEDAMMSTPQIHKLMDVNAVTPYGAEKKPDSLDWFPHHSPNPQAFTSLRDAKSKRRGPGSVGRRSRLTTPDPQPQMARRDSIAMKPTLRDQIMRSPMGRVDSRRESLSLGTNHLHLTSSNESGDESMFATPGVVRRPVVRRSNLLPKTKGFARIRAALQEESAPVENEVKREAEVVKQVHQNYKDHEFIAPTAPPSPNAVPKMGRQESSVSMSDVDFFSNGQDEPKLDPDHRRSSNQKEFFPNMYSGRTTPPPLGRPRSSSNMSEDVGMDSPYMSRRSTPPSSFPAIPASINTPKPTVETAPENWPAPARMPTQAEIAQKVNNKRRRDDDFDIASIKRRAVSPGLSVQSSPVPGQSPMNTGGWWDKPRLNRDNTLPSANVEERANSIPHGTPVLGPKRMGPLQGMTDTSDGLMKMSIE